MKYLLALFVAAVAVASVPVGFALWPPVAASPPAGIRPFLVFVGLCEGASFGAGLLWLAVGRRLLPVAGASPLLRASAHLGIGWLFLNWWAHDGLHRSAFGQTYSGVATIDVLFHSTLIAATAAVAAYFVVAARGFEVRGGRGAGGVVRRSSGEIGC